MIELVNILYVIATSLKDYFYNNENLIHTNYIHINMLIKYNSDDMNHAKNICHFSRTNFI